MFNRLISVFVISFILQSKERQTHLFNIYSECVTYSPFPILKQGKSFFSLWQMNNQYMARAAAQQHINRVM